MQNSTAIKKKVWQLLTMLNEDLPYNPEIILLALHPRERKMYVYTRDYTQMFIVALFITAKK